MGSPYAKFTMTYQEAIEIDPTIAYNLTLDTQEHSEKLQNMIKDRYWNWEIGGETLGEFKAMLSHRFRTIRDYYIELIQAYETKINMLDGKKTSVIVDENTISKDTSSGTLSHTGTNSGDGKNYDLPRSNATENRPSSRNESSLTTNTTDTSSGTTDKQGTRDKTVTTTGGENVIELKNQYLKLLRNVWLELVNELSPCFLDLFF